MSAPQTKERPSVLRAMFSSLSSLFTGKDKAKTVDTASSPAAPAPKAAAAAEPATAAEPEAEAEAAEPEATVIEAETEIVAVESDPVTGEPEAVVIETEIVEVETDPVTGEPEVVVETDLVMLPLANYDELTVASLRARLRNLSVEQLTEILDYEKAHAARPDVITMFERRIAKVQAEA
jgi:hypothetical protein